MAEHCEPTRKIELVQESRPDQTPSPRYLSVDESKRPRANSDPVGLRIHISTVPEITITGDECRTGGRSEEDENDRFLIPPSPRRRAKTCPEDMFRTRKGRPPTPPPTDIRILRSPAGKRFSFNISNKDISSVSFAHHRLTKVSEEKADQQQKVSVTESCKLSFQISACNYFSTTDASRTTYTDDMDSRPQTLPEEADACTKHSCEQCATAQLCSLSVSEKSVTEASNKKPHTERIVNSDVITSPPDTWRSPDTSRDNLDNQRLTAY